MKTIGSVVVQHLCGLRHLGVLVFTLFVFLRANAAEVQVSVPVRHRGVLERHCQSCHGADKQKGKFRLDDLSLEIGDVETAERWQKVLNALNSGEMPPEEEKQPRAEEKADLIDDLSTVMVLARKALADRNGAVVMRRLNRREYGNTLRRLLGVEINVTELPADSGSGSFDTVGANLFMSANQFEQYMGLAREALDEALEWRANVGVERKIRMEAEDSLKVIRKNYDDNLDALERATQWVKRVDEAIGSEENAKVVEELRGRLKKEDLVRREWAKIKGAPAPEDFGFRTVENNADKALGALSYGTKIGRGYMRPFHETYLAMPHLDTGAYLTVGGGGDIPNDSLTIMVPYAWKSIVGDYVLRVRIAALESAPVERRFIEFGIDPRNGQVLSTHEVTGTIERPQTIEIPVSLTRRHMERSNRTLFIREKGVLDHFLVTRRFVDAAKRRNGVGPENVLWVDSMELERIPDSRRGEARGLEGLDGLLDGEKAPAIELVRAGVERFCREAFRGRQPEGVYLDKVLGLYSARVSKGEKHVEALKHVLSVVLSSPQFLYLAEPSEEDHRRPLTGLELATRLSYFLQGGPPDEGLRRLGVEGGLGEGANLEREALRILDGPGFKGFTQPFVHQWLNLDRLDFFEVNREVHPRFDASTKLSARLEVLETFDHLFRTNGSLRDLLRSGYAVLNPVMAHFYGFEGVHGDGFRRVALPADSVRGGLLGMSAVMFMGGNGERTSPVERGAWVLRKVLNEPPPPAPANVPQLARLAGKVLTTHERLMAHQQDPQCASCHRKIDPVGFGLENFDAVGLWRTEDTYQVKDENGKPVKGASKTWEIEVRSALYKGPSFNGFPELREIVAGRVEPFARGFSMALIEYAMGRPIGFRDEALADAMVGRARGRDYAVREFVLGLVRSEDFRMK
jgi:hypothetical protein